MSARFRNPGNPSQARNFLFSWAFASASADELNGWRGGGMDQYVLGISADKLEWPMRIFGLQIKPVWF